MERFGIPHDQSGNINFSPDMEKLLHKCDLAELLLFSICIAQLSIHLSGPMELVIISGNAVL